MLNECCSLFQEKRTRDHMLEKERDKSEISLQDPKISEHALFFTGVHPRSEKLDFTLDALESLEQRSF